MGRKHAPQPAGKRPAETPSPCRRSKAAKNVQFRGTDSIESARFFWEFDEPVVMKKKPYRQTVVSVLN